MSEREIIDDRKCDVALEPTRIKWDEETIARHNLDRGTRMKIEEPKTPYRYLQKEGSDPKQPHTLEWKEFHAKLEDVEQAQKNEAEEARKSEDHRSDHFEKKGHTGKLFDEQRKVHYNEFQMAKAWKDRQEDDVDMEVEEES
uniref:Uncharacterized protein AlNc14C76G5102 n=1 Tax=Albugo laibachii Nc14 TaxID=890382 RepID=F0WEQ2_9STRA|nr:conserved hypothetical protein [Albugo laibachii Nc14]|eukprot:CCA19684.1 conserved hypothetical protein [Albugo laibachii Nc14]